MANMNGDPGNGIDFGAAYTEIAGLGDEAFETRCEPPGACIETAALSAGVVALRNTGYRGGAIVGTPEEITEFAKGWLESMGD